MQSLPSGICDYCSNMFYENDFSLKQVSNEIHDLFKLDFCNINCLKSIQNEYPFVEDFEFKNIQITKNMNKEICCDNSDSDSESESESEKDIIISSLIRNCPSVVFDFSGETPVKRGPCEMIKYYYDLKNNKIRDLKEEDKYFLEFSDNNNLFNINKIKIDLSNQ
jgi:hypothetical protein